MHVLVAHSDNASWLATGTLTKTRLLRFKYTDQMSMLTHKYIYKENPTIHASGR